MPLLTRKNNRRPLFLPPELEELFCLTALPFHVAEMVICTQRSQSPNALNHSHSSQLHTVKHQLDLN